MNDVHDACLAKNERVQEMVWRHLFMVQPYGVFGGMPGLAGFSNGTTFAVLDELVKQGRVEQTVPDEVPKKRVGTCFICLEPVIEYDFATPSLKRMTFRCLGEPRYDIMTVEQEVELFAELHVKKARKPKRPSAANSRAGR